MKLRKKVCAIFAISWDDILAQDNKYPWSLYDDYYNNFLSKTNYHPIIMGATTAAIMKKPIPNRLNIVISSHSAKSLGLSYGFIMTKTIEESLNVAETYYGSSRKIWVIGGAKLLKSFEERGLITEYRITRVLGIFHDPAKKEVIYSPDLREYYINGIQYFAKSKLSQYKERNTHSFMIATFKKES